MPIRSLRGHEDRVTSVAYSPDGRWIATAAWDGTARLWEAETGKEVRRLDVPAPRDYRLAHLCRVLFTPDGEFVVAAQQAALDEVGVLVWNRRTGEKVYEFTGGHGCAAVSPNGRFIACGGWGRGTSVNTGVIRLYQLATGELVRELHGQQARIGSLTFSLDGDAIVSTGPLPRPRREVGATRALGFMPDVVRVWDVATGKERRRALDGVVGGLDCPLALSTDGRTVAHANRHKISLRETATGGERATLTGHTADPCALAFSPDGRTLASGSQDGTVRLWDPFSAKELGRLGTEGGSAEGGWVLSVAISPDGRSLVSAQLDGGVHVWDVCRITGRPGSPVERSQADLETDWDDLCGDVAAGYAALGRLIFSPDGAVRLLGKRLEAAAAADTKPIERLIGNLDHEDFRVREQAAKELRVLGDRAAPSLRKALSGHPSPEAAARLAELLNRIDGTTPSAETMREVRAVEALEAIGSPEARRSLERLAAGPAGMRLTQEAKASAERLIKRSSIRP
jgi:WD40 repeat protein